MVHSSGTCCHVGSKFTAEFSYDDYTTYKLQDIDFINLTTKIPCQLFLILVDFVLSL